MSTLRLHFFGPRQCGFSVFSRPGQLRIWWDSLETGNVRLDVAECKLGKWFGASLHCVSPWPSLWGGARFPSWVSLCCQRSHCHCSGKKGLQKKKRQNMTRPNVEIWGYVGWQGRHCKNPQHHKESGPPIFSPKLASPCIPHPCPPPHTLTFLSSPPARPLAKAEQFTVICLDFFTLIGFPPVEAIFVIGFPPLLHLNFVFNAK